METDVDLLARIQAVDPVHADTMSRRPTTFTVEPLSFYRTFKLVKAAVALPQRELEFRYADDGRLLIHLTGKEEAVYRVNDADGMALTEDHVAPYVRFFLSNFTNDSGTSWEVAENPGELVWLPATETDPALRAVRAEASARIRPLAPSGVPGRYRVVGTAVEGRHLVELDLSVDGRGRVTPLDTSKILFEDLPLCHRL
jgi:hypothetical protein